VPQFPLSTALAVILEEIRVAFVYFYHLFSADAGLECSVQAEFGGLGWNSRKASRNVAWDKTV
jgi:hypothetical protein